MLNKLVIFFWQACLFSAFSTLAYASNTPYQVDASDGSYIYEEVDSDENIRYYEAPKLSEDRQGYSITSKGEYLYDVEESERYGTLGIRFGTLQAPAIVSKDNIPYSSFYGDQSLGSFLVDYELLQFQGAAGHFALVVGSGLSMATGKGRFKSDLAAAMETYTLAVIPNHISLSYRLQYFKHQYLTPYASGGLAPLFLIETRDDNSPAKYLMAPAAVVATGVKLNITALDRASALAMDAEYGVNDMWLDIELRVFQGLDDKLNINSQMINAGFGFDY